MLMSGLDYPTFERRRRFTEYALYNFHLVKDIYELQEKEIDGRHEVEMAYIYKFPVLGEGSPFFWSDYMRAQKLSRVKDEIIFITINPSDEVSLSDFKQKVEKYVKRPFCLNCVYTFEQRGKTESEMGRGMHCHLVIDKIKKHSPKYYLDTTFSTFAKMVGSKASIDIRKYPKSYREEKIGYLKGDKWDSEKEDAVKINELWRTQNDLKKIYI